MLNLDKINVYYGAIHAIKDISIEVNEGEIVTLIGANGAGKTSTLRAISGLQPLKSGTVTFKNSELNKIPANKIVSLGLSHVPEGRRVFPQLSVLENLELGAYLRNDKAGIKQDMEMVFSKFPRLKERIKQHAGTLSGGEQQMLAIGRALMNRPEMLILDEPSMGLAPIFIQEIFDIIQDIQNASKEQLLGIEQINDAVNQLDQQTQQNAMVASQTHDVAVLTDQIAKLVVSNADEKEFKGKNEVKAKSVKAAAKAIHAAESHNKIVSNTNKSAPKPVAAKHEASHVTPTKAVEKDDGEWESF